MRQPCAAGGYKSVMSSMSCCNRHSPECTARKVEGDYTATSPVKGTVAAEVFARGKRQKAIEAECPWQNITQAKDGSRARGTD